MVSPMNTAHAEQSPILACRATCFDGKTSRRWPVQVQLLHDALRLTPVAEESGVGESSEAPAEARSYRFAELKLGELWHDAPLAVELPDGGSLWLSGEATSEKADKVESHEVSQLTQALIQRVSSVQGSAGKRLPARIIDSWPAVIACLLATVALLVWFDRQGASLIATAALKVIPQSVDHSIGDAALATINEQWLTRTELPKARQLRLKKRFDDVASQMAPDHPVQLRFHRMRSGEGSSRSERKRGGGGGGRAGSDASTEEAAELDVVDAQEDEEDSASKKPRSKRDEGGFNAFALPNGTIIVLDGLAKGLSDDEVLAVLGHELGHVVHRHGMKGVMRSVGLLSVAGVVLGDFSTVVASTVATLQTFHYSRDDEREADTFGARFAEAAALPAGTIAAMWRKLQKEEQDAGMGGIPAWMSTHPPTDERLKAAEGR